MKMMRNIRWFVWFMCITLIPIFVITIDAEGEESALDQVKDFTALIIICDIDNILLAASGINFDDLEIEYDETLE